MRHRHRLSLHLSAVGIAFLVAAPGPAQLGPTGTQFWNQGSTGIGIPLQEDSGTGSALAAGDFDCNGYADLAVGMPGDTVGGHAEAGEVLVLYSDATGPATFGHDLLSQNTPGILDSAEAGDRFGASLAAADFDGDGCDDLAIGAPGESIEAPALVVEAGAVHVLYGGALGLGVDGDGFFTQDTPGIAGLAQTDDRFGTRLLAGQADFDAYDDLVIGVPDEDLEGGAPVTDAGAVHVLFGDSGGLVGTSSATFVPGDSVLNYVPSSFDRAGDALALGRFSLLGPRELAIGIPGRPGPGGVAAAGGVAIVVEPGGSDPLTYYYDQDIDGVPGAREAFDRFGAALASGDFDGDGIDELAVGVPGEDLEAVPAESAGVVIVLGPFFGNHELWTQDDLPPEHADPMDRFGAALAAADFDADGYADLAIGVPGESLSVLTEAGVVHVVRGSENGLTTVGDQLWLQTLDPSEADDEFGAALVAARFVGYGGFDLAIGAPGEDLAGTADCGGVNVLFSDALFVDGFEQGFCFIWSSIVGGSPCV